MRADIERRAVVLGYRECLSHVPCPRNHDLAETAHSYPKHVWSPAGGWYSRPANWKSNTAIAGLVIFGVTAAVWKLSSELEYRHKMPEPDRFYPSR